MSVVGSAVYNSWFLCKEVHENYKKADTNNHICVRAFLPKAD